MRKSETAVRTIEDELFNSETPFCWDSTEWRESEQVLIVYSLDDGSLAFDVVQWTLLRCAGGMCVLCKKRG
ncbi:hypothetical protein AOLI_G00018740 [Acnodon oligacanthus]